MVGKEVREKKHLFTREVEGCELYLTEAEAEADDNDNTEVIAAIERNGFCVAIYSETWADTVEDYEIHDASFKVGEEYAHHDSSVWTVMVVCPGVYALANKKANRVYSSNSLSREELQGYLDQYFERR